MAGLKWSPTKMSHSDSIWSKKYIDVLSYCRKMREPYLIPFPLLQYVSLYVFTSFSWLPFPGSRTQNLYHETREKLLSLVWFWFQSSVTITGMTWYNKNSLCYGDQEAEKGNIYDWSDFHTSAFRVSVTSPWNSVAHIRGGSPLS